MFQFNNADQNFKMSMKKIIIGLSILFISNKAILSQNVQARIVLENTSTANNSVVSFQVRTVVGTQLFVGVSMYFLYQQPNLVPQSTTYNWGTALRTTTPFQAFGPSTFGGQSYTRRYVYINADEGGGANVQTLTTTWITLFTITFNNLNPGGPAPQGGYGYLQETTEFINAALTDENGVNVPIDVVTSSIALGTGGTLPVTFSNYNVTCSDKGAVLTWATSSEQNSSKFEIERSEDGVNWYAVGTVGAAGNSDAQRNYQFLDARAGAAKYRIKQVDIDGRFIYTAVKPTNCNSGAFEVLLYPVPAKDYLNVVIKSDKSVRSDLLLIDMKGSIVKRIPVQINKGTTNINVITSELTSGQYLLRSADASVKIDKKFTIAR
jgi:hypothetical protein